MTLVQFLAKLLGPVRRPQPTRICPTLADTPDAPVLEYAHRAGRGDDRGLDRLHITATRGGPQADLPFHSLARAPGVGPTPEAPRRLNQLSVFARLHRQQRRGPGGGGADAGGAETGADRGDLLG